MANSEKQRPNIITLPSVEKLSETNRALLTFSQQLDNDLSNGRINFTHTTVTSWGDININNFDDLQLQFATNSVSSEYRIYLRISSKLYKVDLTQI